METDKLTSRIRTFRPAAERRCRAAAGGGSASEGQVHAGKRVNAHDAATYKRGTDRLIVLVFTITVSLIIFAGFARSYYLREWFVQKRVLPWFVHAHGTLLSAWFALFITQVVLVYNRRPDLHRRLGRVGAFLVPLAVVLGEFVVVRAIARRFPNATLKQSLLLFVAFDGVNLLVFAGLIVSALLLRKRPDVHKRLMLMAVVSALPPALGRVAEHFTHQHVEILILSVMVSGVALCVVTDTLRHHRLHSTMAWAGATIIVSCGCAYLAQVAT